MSPRFIELVIHCLDVPPGSSSTPYTSMSPRFMIHCLDGSSYTPPHCLDVTPVHRASDPLSGCPPRFIIHSTVWMSLSGCPPGSSSYSDPLSGCPPRFIIHFTVWMYTPRFIELVIHCLDASDPRFIELVIHCLDVSP